MRFLPMTAVIIVTAPYAGRYASKHGSRIPMTYGLILAGSGLLLFSRLNVDTPYLLMLPVFVMMGHGIGSTMAPMTAAVMNAVGPERAGLGSAMTNTSREVGGVFGIALLGTLLTTRLRSTLEPSLAAIGLPPETSRPDRRPPPGTASSTRRCWPRSHPGSGRRSSTRSAQSFMSGFRLSLMVGGLALLVAAVIANRFIPGRAHAAEVRRAARAAARSRSKLPRHVG